MFVVKIVLFEIELLVLEMMVLWVVLSENVGKGLGFEVLLLKIKGMQIQQLLIELMVEVVGLYVQLFDLDYFEGDVLQVVMGDNDVVLLVFYYFNYCKILIYGGLNEIQCNIILQMIFGV